MPLTEQELKKMFTKMRDSESIPDFERTWQQAVSRLSEKRSLFTGWRWCLGPTVLFFTSAAAALLIVAVSQGPAPVPLEVAVLDEAGVGRQLPTDLEVRPEAPAALADVPASREESSVVAAGDQLLESVLYEVPTDFLLDLEAPTWDEAQKDSLL